MAKEPKSPDLDAAKGAKRDARGRHGPWAGRLRANPTPSEFALAEGKKKPADFFMIQPPEKGSVAAVVSPQPKEDSAASGKVSRLTKNERKRRVSLIREAHHLYFYIIDFC